MEAHKPTVLLVDDEPQILAVLRRQLRADDYRILTTSNPTEVLSILGAERVDVVVSDVNMPEMNGIDLVSQVRASHPDVARILLTGQVSIDLAVEAINRGEVFRYLTKPWSEGDVRDAVRGAVRLAASARRAAVIERAVARRAQALEHIERQYPEIRDVARTSDGAYVLPSSGRVDIAGRNAEALSVLRELLDEMPTPQPSITVSPPLSAIGRRQLPSEASTLQSAVAVPERKAADPEQVSEVTTLPRQRANDVEPHAPIGARVDGERNTQPMRHLDAPSIEGDAVTLERDTAPMSPSRAAVLREESIAPVSPRGATSPRRALGSRHDGLRVPMPTPVAGSRAAMPPPSTPDGSRAALPPPSPRAAMPSATGGPRAAMPSAADGPRSPLPSAVEAPRAAASSGPDIPRASLPSSTDIPRGSVSSGARLSRTSGRSRGALIASILVGSAAVVAALLFVAWPRATPVAVPMAPVISVTVAAPPSPSVTAEPAVPAQAAPAPTAAPAWSSPAKWPTRASSKPSSHPAPSSMGDLKIPDFKAP